MTLEQLKPGDKIYCPGMNFVNSFVYIGIHPTIDKYHILLDNNQKAKLLTDGLLSYQLSRSFNTYEEAEFELAKSIYNTFVDYMSRSEKLQQWYNEKPQSDV